VLRKGKLMDAWDKLVALLAHKFGEADAEVIFSGPIENGSRVEITLADLRQIVKEGHPDV
jgi:hypothetical protein